MLSGYPYWPGWDIARGLDIHYNSQGVPDGGWVLDAWGGIHPFGAAYDIPASHYYPGFNIFQGFHVAPGGAYEVARWGLIEQVGSPSGISYAGMPDYGSWDIVRDVVPVNPSGPSQAAPFQRDSMGSAMSALNSADRAARGDGPLGESSILDAIAGNGASYNLASCGGPSVVISDRTMDMYQRNYFAHPIPGCAGTQYVFSTYMSAYNVGYRTAGENIAWRSGDTSQLDDVWNINQMWLASPSHYANIMGPYSSIGCGTYYAQSGSYQGASGPLWIWACEFSG
jgi:hypothetical protein